MARLRTNGKKTTLTIKEVHADTVDGTNEIEVEVSDFEATNKILEKLGYNYKNYQENKRVSYKLDGVMVEIDSWPLIPTHLEIEGKNAEEVYQVAEKLGYKKEDTTTLGITGIYEQVYNINLLNIRELKDKVD
ncbi:MAG TPA: adenylate cyclase [Clostridiales bacterium]|nr:adenylate cyclase [Clostridiales bacterium]